MSVWKLAGVVLLLAVGGVRAEEKLVVHEWGTFTSLQDEEGKAIGGINVEDEPLPGFVHEIERGLLVEAGGGGKGVAAAHPDVTMRLETPVVYFHPAEGVGPLKVDVRVRFMGGWLTQYYPDAAAGTQGPGEGVNFRRRMITEKTVGSLEWKGVTVGGEAKWPTTGDHVWTAPRAVAAADVATGSGEGERFLFYRGVGHVDSPVKISRGSDGEIWERSGFGGPMWLVDIREDGAVAFRRVESKAGNSEAVAIGSGAFALGDYAKGNLGLLRDSMRGELVKAGLFEDEAEALLSTWELSYFKSVGERVFFLVPREWTDRVLLLEVSVPCEMTRVMVGRVELVGPRERGLLKRIARGPIAEKEYSLWKSVNGKAVANDETPPGEYLAWRSLGRLRDAMVLNELANRPTESLRRFVEEYGLSAAVIDGREASAR